MDEEVDLKAVVAPAGKLHHAGLLVKGEVLDVNEAGGLEDGRAEPGHVAVRGHDHVGAERPWQKDGYKHRRGFGKKSKEGGGRVKSGANFFIPQDNFLGGVFLFLLYF